MPRCNPRNRSFVTPLLCKRRTIEGRKENISSFTLLHPVLHIQDFLNQELAYGSDIDIGRLGPLLLLDFDDLPAGGSLKEREKAD